MTRHLISLEQLAQALGCSRSVRNPAITGTWGDDERQEAA